MRQFLLGVASLALVACSGCRPSASVANASSNDFTVGAAVYTKRDHAFAGKVAKYEPNYTFPDGQTGPAVLIQGTDGQAGWHHADTLSNSFTTH